MSIHEEHPFKTPEAQRDPVRRLRGRLSAPVTIVTAGSGKQRTGLTVSSLVVAEGEPGHIAMLVGSDADLLDVITETGRFVVHILTADDRALSDVFAGIRPSPGGLFAGLGAEDSAHGPVIGRLANRASCSLVEVREIGFTNLVIGSIDRIEIDDLTNPLTYFRGTYRELG